MCQILLISIQSEVFPVPPRYIFPTHTVFILNFFLNEKFLIKFIIIIINAKGINKMEI